MVMLVLTPFWAYRWYRLPFLGMLIEPHNVVSLVRGADWPAINQGAQFDDRVIALDGEPVADVRAAERALAANGYEPISVTFERRDGSQFTLEITPVRPAFADILSLFIIPYFVGLLFLVIGLWAYSLRGELWESRALVVFVSGVAILTSGFLDISTTHRATVIWTLGLLLTGGGMIHLALLFPQPMGLVGRYPRLRFAHWIVSALGMIPMLMAVSAPRSPYDYISAWLWGYAYIIVAFVILLSTLLWRILYSHSSYVRQQSRVIIFGAILAFFPVVVYLLSLVVGLSLDFHAWIIFPPMVLLPLSITYAILRYRLLDVDRVLSRVLTYALTTAAALGAFYGVVALLTVLVQEAVRATDPLVIASYLLLLAVGLMPLRRLIQRAIDRLFYRAPADYRRALSDLSRGLVITPDLGQMLRVLEEQLRQALAPEKFVLYLYNDDLGQYFPHAAGPDSAPPYAADDALIRLLRDSSGPLWLPPSGPLPEALLPEEANYRRLAGFTFVPLRYEGKLTGFFLLGPRRSGDLYTSDDLDFLAAMAAQSSLALENARLFANLRRTLDQTLEMKNLMDDIFASIATGVITTDLRRKITLFNRAAEQILGIPVDRAIGRPLARAVPGLGADLESVTASAMRDGRVILNTELSRHIPSRGDLHLRLSCSPLRDAYLETKGATIFFEDLTERRKLEAEQERIRQTFGRVVAPRVRDRLLADPGNLRLDGTKQVVTILFADLKGFTPYSEKTPPETVFKVLNTYLSLAAQTILEEEGTLDKFMGDAVLALWNSPDPQEDHALRAVRAAQAIVRRARQAHHDFPDPEQHLVFRIGIATGAAVVGNVGTSELFNYTAIGDMVNLAQRIQASARPGQILLHESTYAVVADHVLAEPLKAIKVKGRRQAVEVYQLRSLRQADAKTAP